MKYRITHITSYKYADPVSVCHSEAYLTPRTFERQVCDYHRLSITPSPSSSGRRTDFFDNPLVYFSFNTGFESLQIKTISRVEVYPRIPIENPLGTPPWESISEKLKTYLEGDEAPPALYAFGSPRIPLSRELADYGRSVFTPQRPIVDAVLALTEKIHQDFEFDPRATPVNTPVEEVMQNRKGVCQDFAHLQIAILRSLGVAARYVSGYLRTYPAPGKPRLVGADASHAWVSVFCGDRGWVDVDPTNNKQVRDEHITLAWGRDYGDVCPLKGVYVGGGRHTLEVSVDVLPLEED
ncbi:MAG: transglutaminase family protein [Planctomycetaceae bacterium]|nr:transglutaminase family protein [Planctomycetaceae bacterium]